MPKTISPYRPSLERLNDAVLNACAKADVDLNAECRREVRAILNFAWSTSYAPEPLMQVKHSDYRLHLFAIRKAGEWAEESKLSNASRERMHMRLQTATIYFTALQRRRKIVLPERTRLRLLRITWYIVKGEGTADVTKMTSRQIKIARLVTAVTREILGKTTGVLAVARITQLEQRCASDAMSGK